jgi:iron complex transport system ATP-binding protein
MSASPAALRALRIEQLQVAYDDHVVIPDASLSAPAGEITALIGPNGAGKSTLLKGIAGLIEARGRVLHDGVELLDLPVARRALHLAMVPQSTSLALSFTAREVVALGRHPHRRRFTRQTEADEREVDSALAAVGALEIAERGVDELSGGQRQLVHIARALAQASPVLLLDEPTSALDLKHQVAVYSLLRERARAGAVVVVVLHDLDDVARWCDRAVLLDDGGVRASGPTDEVLGAALLSEVYDVPITAERSPTTGALRLTPWPREERTPRRTARTATSERRCPQ